MTQEEKNGVKFWAIIILLIIIILLLIFFVTPGYIENTTPATTNVETKIPTGNVDVFDIELKCVCDSKEPKENCVKTKDNRVYVDDADGDFAYHKNLRIFTNAAFKYTNMIAPGVGNVYHFVVHNSTKLNLKYYIETEEESEYKINLKYRLKRNNKYILGDENNWITASELKTEFMDIAKGASDSYALEWKWFDDDSVDIIAGKNMDSLYKLGASFYFEQVED